MAFVTSLVLVTGCRLSGKQVLPLLLQGKSCSSALWTEIFRISGDFIIFSLINKGQLHISRHIIRCILAAKHPRFPDISAGFPIKSKSNGIKKSGLSRTCITGDQIKPFFSQLFKIDHCLFPIRPKGAYNQFFGFILSPPG